MLVGIPTDDWNLQIELNRYLHCPANPPGAFADHGHEHHAYDVVRVSPGAWGALGTLEDVDPSSSWHGARKTFRLTADARTVMVRYDVPGRAAPVCVDTCLSPDYLTLLMNGRTRIRHWSR